MDWNVLLNFWPLLVLQLGLAIMALLDIRKRRKFNHLSRGAWIVIIIVLNIIGPILYFVMGRSDA